MLFKSTPNVTLTFTEELCTTIWEEISGKKAKGRRRSAPQCKGE